MSNHFFKFKQFTVNQDQCAMKVCTDSCLFGAWVADYLEKEKNDLQHILDIGTGTGLLSLMLAQKTNTNIDAVEIEQTAAMQAATNFSSSPWGNQLHVFNEPIQFFKKTNQSNYDFIISNPPFFENDLKSADQLKNIALHSKALTLKELIQQIKFHLKPNGQFAVLLPFDKSEYFIDEAQQLGFYIQLTTHVKQTPKHAPFRSMMLFGTSPISSVSKEIIIKENNEYTGDFRQLLTHYYLPF